MEICSWKLLQKGLSEDWLIRLSIVKVLSVIGKWWCIFDYDLITRAITLLNDASYGTSNLGYNIAFSVRAVCEDLVANAFWRINNIVVLTHMFDGYNGRNRNPHTYAILKCCLCNTYLIYISLSLTNAAQVAWCGHLNLMSDFFDADTIFYQIENSDTCENSDSIAFMRKNVKLKKWSVLWNVLTAN